MLFMNRVLQFKGCGVLFWANIFLPDTKKPSLKYVGINKNPIASGAGIHYEIEKKIPVSVNS